MTLLKNCKKDHNIEILYGLNPVQAALEHEKRKFKHLYINQNNHKKTRLGKILASALKLGLSITEATNSQLNQHLNHVNHQGVALKCSPLPELSWENFQDPNFHNKSINSLAVLDQVEDPQNLGAIIRSCGFFKIKALVISRKHSCHVTPSVSKASAGVAEWFPVITTGNLTRFLEQRKKDGYWVIGLERDASITIQDIQQDRPWIIVLGSEGQGLRPLVSKTCDLLVCINGDKRVESLNVSNSAAIALHHLYVSCCNSSQQEGL